MKTALIFQPVKVIRCAVLTLLLSCLFQIAFGQISIKKYIFPASSMFLAGMMDGTVETISYHYDNGFKPRFPNANDNFWNPERSWKNKYKAGSPPDARFPGSTTFLVCTTDGYHLLRMFKRSSDIATIAYYINYAYSEKMTPKKNWKQATLDFAILTLVRSAGFTLTYSVLFKVKAPM